MNRQAQTPSLPTPLGVIDTLSAGLSVMVRHAWLLLFPVAIDLFLWLAPPLLISNSFLQMLFPPLNFNTMLVSAPDPELAPQMQSMYDGLVQQLAQSNFWGVAIPSGLFFPSVMVGQPVNATDIFWSLDNAGAILLTIIGMSLIGLVVNVAWLHTVAYSITRNAGLLKIGAMVRSFFTLLGLGILLLLIVLGVLFVTSILLAVLSLILPGIGAAIGTLLFLFASWGMVWYGVQLYFTIASLIVSGHGVMGALSDSTYLLRRHPDNPHWRSGYGFIFISVILSWGFAFIWQSLMANPLGRVVSILGNAALGTGITAAMMLYYSQRTLSQPKTNRVIETTTTTP